MANAIAVPAPAPTISLGKLVRFAAKALGLVLMITGVMAILGTTALCGLTVYGAKWLADQLPVLDGPGYDGTSAETAMVVQAMNERGLVQSMPLIIVTQGARDIGMKGRPVAFEDPQTKTRAAVDVFLHINIQGGDHPGEKGHRGHLEGALPLPGGGIGRAPGP